MRLLLDTHFLIWIAVDPKAIRPAERAILDRSGTGFLVPVLSIREIRIKWNQRDPDGSRRGAAQP